MEPFHNTLVLQCIGYLGQLFDGRVWSLHARDILQRQGHPGAGRAFTFPPYSPDLALMDFFVWPQVAKKVLIHYGPSGILETIL